MLIRFSCKAFSDITMFGDVGKKMLTMMGHSETVPGAILAEDIPQALALLKDALAKEKYQHHEEPQEDAQDDEFQDTPVSIGNRALPLIELLTAAEKEGCDVMWQDATGSSFL